MIQTERDERDKRSKCNMRFQTGRRTAKKKKKENTRSVDKNCKAMIGQIEVLYQY